ncbi:unnamed protein product [Heterobilharzia americana]|nr:unnamed protein product [Heterobilharzia americana]CAH8559470.1 unnamed protein product [Heterobilharzia americana]
MSQCDQQPLSLEQINLKVGDVVYVGSGTQRIGKIEFIGETQFSAGEWIGISLFSPLGKNDGKVDGVVYFSCKPSHGIFSKRANVRLAGNADLSESHGNVGSMVLGDVISGEHCKQNSVVDFGSVYSSKYSAVNSPVTSAQRALQTGDHVQVSGGRIGILRYLGPTEFAVGEWAGIELDEPIGKNDGSVAGIRYFTCKPNHGLFAAASRVVRAGGKDECHTPGFDVSKNSQLRRSQESLLSYSSNLSSVSRSYQAQKNNNGLQARNGMTGSRRPTSSVNTSCRRETASNLQTLQRLIKEKEAHIEQLLQEREIERSDLAKVTLEKEMAQAETVNQRAVIQNLNQRLENMEAVLQHLRDEHEQTTIKLQEERKNLEDLQFRMEEENIDKTTLESQNADDESKIFELEEALMSAREANELMETELNKVKTELNNLLKKQSEVIVTHNDQNKLKDQEEASLQITNSVSAMLIPVNEKDEQTLKVECDRLRLLLAERQSEAENLLKRQAETIEALTVDFNGQIEKLNCQLQNSSVEIKTFKEENNELKQQNDKLIINLKNQIEQLNKQLTEQENSANEKLVIFEQRIAELNNLLEIEKSKSTSSFNDHHQTSGEELNNLREQQRAIMEELTEYHNVVLSSAESCHALQVEEVNNLQVNDETTISLSSSLLLEKLKVQEELLNEQKEQLTNFKLQYETSIHDKENSENKLCELEDNLERIKEELAESKARQDALLVELNGTRLKRDQLMEEISTILGDLSVAEKSENLSTVLHQRINDLKEQISCHEKNRQDLEKYCQTLENERNELESELTRVNVTLKNAMEVHVDSSSLKEELDNARQKMLSLEKSASNAFDQLEVKSNELQAIQAQLDKVLNDQMELEKVHNHSITLLESEKQVLLKRIEEAENRLSEQQQKQSIPTALNTNKSSQDSEQVDVNGLLEEKASTESQVAFLNSIIVDLHAKNAELESRVRAMLVGTDEQLDSPSNRRAKSRGTLPPPRLWCDNCLVFDNHDTNDCRQLTTNNHNNNNIPNHNLRYRDIINGTHVTGSRLIINPTTTDVNDDQICRKSSLKAYHKSFSLKHQTSNRVYCDNCGVFDNHTTENCNDTQTF